MSTRANLTSVHVAPTRCRAARRLDLFVPPTEARTAAAMDDVEEAEQLIADLLALVDAGLIDPISDPAHSSRYAPADDDLDSAANRR
jgi:hypothetical protein